MIGAEIRLNTLLKVNEYIDWFFSRKNRSNLVPKVFRLFLSSQIMKKQNVLWTRLESVRNFDTNL